MTYRLSGRDAGSFTLNEDSGQLRTQTGVDYNYEVQNRYSVTVEAADDQGGRATIAVTIDITDDDNERPQRPDRPSVTASTLTSLTLQVDRAGQYLVRPSSDYNVQYREGSSGRLHLPWRTMAHGTTTTIANLKSETAL